MITSFFKKAPPAAAPSEEEPVRAAAPTDSAAKRLKVAAADGGSANKGLTPANNTNGGDKKARRRGVIDDSDDEMPAEVTPAPLASLDGGGSTAVPMETERETAQEKPEEKATVPAAPPVTDADASAAVKPAAAKVASGAASSSSFSLQGPSSKAKEAESDEGEEDDEDDDDDEEAASDAEEQPAAADGPSSKKPLALKQAKSKSKAKASAKQGVTAASVAYHKYDVLGAATWKPGAPVPYLFLARVFGKIEDESKRLLITEMMANAFRTVIATSPGDLGAVMALATMRLAPAYEGIELGIGDSIMVKAVAETCGRSVKAIKADMEEVGDLGVVAMNSRTKQVTLCKPKALSVAAVLKTLKEIAQTSGNEAMKRKGDKIKTMLVAAQEKEAQYLVRSLQGKMRIGLAEQTALVALAHAFVLQHPCKEDGTPSDAAPCTLRGEALQERLAHAETVIKQVYSEMPNYDIIIPALVKHGIDKLHEHAQLTAGVPVKPMLAKPTKGIGEVLDRFSNCAFTCEFKYDGERAQIHLLEDGTVKIFSRNSEDNTTKYPDIAAIVPRAVKQGQTKSAILDAEAVAVDTKTGAILPFQVLSTRKRKDVSAEDVAVKVCIFAFDLLYLNGESYLHKPLGERRAALRSSFEVLPREFEFAIASDAADPEAIQEFLMESIKGNCEGLMVKTLEVDATYEPSKRSLNWLKVKKDYLAGMGDSCDLVPLGAYYGKGKRTGVYGAYLLACYNAEDETYESVCKIGTGFNDEALQSLHASLKDKLIDAPRAYYRVPDWAEAQMPDVWFEPCQVWEVLAADLSISPVHMAAAGLVDPSKGIALRFPRFIRLRDDKGVEDATSAEQIADMYNNQAINTKSTGGDDD